MYVNILILFFTIVGCNTNKFVNTNQILKTNNISINKNSEIETDFAYDNAIWDELLQKNVDDLGNVNYKGFIEEKDKFETYLNYLTANKVSENASDATQIAYWINVYNAFTVKLIIDNYPLKSIKDIKSGIPFINDVWAIDFIKFDDETISLNKVEHGTLRKNFDEPRIHFAVNCASYSCPRLYNKAFTAQNLEETLTLLTKDFIYDTRKNDISDLENLKLSKLFLWYGGDFKINGKSKIDFLNKYVDTKINEKAKIDFLDYGWSLNEK